jgi:hypothetical protein
MSGAMNLHRVPLLAARAPDATTVKLVWLPLASRDAWSAAVRTDTRTKGYPNSLS